MKLNKILDLIISSFLVQFLILFFLNLVDCFSLEDSFIFFIVKKDIIGKNKTTNKAIDNHILLHE